MLDDSRFDDRSTTFSLEPGADRRFEIVCSNQCDIDVRVSPAENTLSASGTVLVSIHASTGTELGVTTSAVNTPARLTIRDAAANTYAIRVKREHDGSKTDHQIDVLWEDSPFLCDATVSAENTGRQCSDNSEGFFDKCPGECRNLDANGTGECFLVKKDVVPCAHLPDATVLQYRFGRKDVAVPGDRIVFDGMAEPEIVAEQIGRYLEQFHDLRGRDNPNAVLAVMFVRDNPTGPFGGTLNLLSGRHEFYRIDNRDHLDWPSFAIVVPGLEYLPAELAQQMGDSDFCAFSQMPPGHFLTTQRSRRPGQACLRSTDFRDNLFEVDDPIGDALRFAQFSLDRQLPH